MESKTRSATRADIEAFYGGPLPYTSRAMVIEIDGEIVMVAGVMHSSPLLAFMDMRDRLRESPRVLMRSIPQYREILGKYDGTVVAKPNENEAGAARFLERVGFREAHLRDKRIFVWDQQH